ncbi:MAG TPA: TonB-dependent receptor [Acidobacteriota bacterium]|nr:TonB-dependent receptor [Acidobacteriota bacterium]
MLKSLLTAALLAAAILLATGSVPYAQVTQTGVIAGQVFDSDSEPIVAARITVSNIELLGSKVSTITDGEGRFRIPGLTPGVYSIEIFHEDFIRQVLNDVYLKVDEIVRITIVLQAEGEEPVEIPRQPVPLVDIAALNLEEILSPDMLRRLPNRRNLTDALQFFSGAFEVGDGIAIGGGAPVDNAYILDGVVLNDPHDGTPSAQPVFDLIFAVDLTSAILDSASRSATGGTVTITTLMSPNRYSGEASFFMNSSDLNSINYPGAIKPDDYLVTPSLSLGGPVLSGRSWFYAGFSYIRNRYTDSPTRLSPEETSGHLINSKVFFRLNDRTDLRAAYLRDSADRNQYYSPDTAVWTILEPESDRVDWDQYSSTNLLFFGVEHRLSETVTLHLTAERLWRKVELLPSSGDKNYRSKYDPVELVVYEGSPLTEWEDGKTSRWLLKGGFDYYLDELAGTHDISLGTEYERSLHNSRRDITGDNRAIFINRPEWPNERELYVELLRTQENFAGPIETQNYLSRFSVFASDNWLLFPELAVHFGVRYDGVVVDNSTAHVIDWDEISPRMGISWDPFGNGKTVLRAGYASYHASAMTAMAPTDPFYIARRFNTSTLEKLGFAGINGEMTSSIFDSATRYGYAEDWNDANLNTEAPRTDEYYLAAEYEPRAQTHLEVNLVFRKTRNMLEDLETNLWDSYINASGIDSRGQPYPFRVRTPGKDGTYLPKLYWTSDPRLKRKYVGFGVNLQSKPLPFLHAQLRYLWSKTEGNVDVTLQEDSPFSYLLNSPNSLINSYGYLSADHRHDLKLLLYGDLPYGFCFGAVARYLSGAPYNRLLRIPPESDPLAYTETIFADPRGTVYRLDNQLTIDLRIEKIIVAGDGSLSLILDIFNLLNSKAVTKRFEIDGDLFGEPLLRIPPRSIRLGVSYSF